MISNPTRRLLRNRQARRQQQVLEKTATDALTQVWMAKRTRLVSVVRREPLGCYFVPTYILHMVSLKLSHTPLIKRTTIKMLISFLRRTYVATAKILGAWTCALGARQRISHTYIN